MPFFDSVIRWAESSAIGPRHDLAHPILKPDLSRRILQDRTGLLFELYALLFILFYCIIRNVRAHTLPFALRKATNSTIYNQNKKLKSFGFVQLKGGLLFFWKLFSGDNPKGTFWTPYKEKSERVPPWNTGYALYKYRRYMYPNLYRCRYRYRYDVITGIGTSITVQDTFVGSARHRYQYRTLWYVRYDINIDTGDCGKFGVNSIPVPDTWYVRYGIHTGTGHSGKFVTASITVANIPVPYRTHPDVILHPQMNIPLLIEGSPNILKNVSNATNIQTNVD